MGDFSHPETEAVLAAFDFSGIDRLVDVGGGRGELMMAVLRANPGLRGTAFDQPHVVAPVTVPADLHDRLELAGGDFFATAPAGADAYLLKHILHDWHDDACRRILSHIRAATAPGGRVLILEQVIPPGNSPFPGEYALLLESAGLNLRRIHPTVAAVSVVEAGALR
jgi:hypothetical protein